MKKLLVTLLLVGFILMPQSVHAYDYSFSDYENILDEMNEENNTDYALLTEKDFNTYDGYKEIYGTYQNYQDAVLALSLKLMKEMSILLKQEVRVLQNLNCLTIRLIE